MTQMIKNETQRMSPNARSRPKESTKPSSSCRWEPPLKPLLTLNIRPIPLKPNILQISQKEILPQNFFLVPKKGTGTSKGQENNERSQKCIQNQENKVAYPKLSDPNFLRCLYVKHTTMAQQNGLSHSIKSILKEFVIHLWDMR